MHWFDLELSSMTDIIRRLLSAVLGNPRSIDLIYKEQYIMTDYDKPS